MKYSISQAAELFGLKPHTLRFYEKEGVLPCKRQENGIRYYTQEEIEKLEMICCLKNTGMQLRQIKKYFDLCNSGDDTMEERLYIFTNHRLQVKEEIALLYEHLEKIEKKINWYKNHMDTVKKESVAGA